MARDWRSAYFQQAHSDYRLFQKIAIQEDVPLCHKLHYLQMTTEKMAKGFLTPKGAGEYKRSHNAFGAFVRQSKMNSTLFKLYGFSSFAQ